ncbi:MAG: phage tail tube protein [Planctomycetota bacterium]|jgi:TP901-1 family phage major tail protein
MAIRLGMEAVLNYKTGGQDGAGSWVELANVRDVTLSLEAGEADVTTRANSGWRAVVATLKEASVEFEMVWDTADAGFGAVKDAYLNNAPIGMQILDGSSSGAGEGLQADFMITSFSRSESLEEAITVSVTAKVTYSDTPPSWIGG